jgi:putative cell wall-binding protein
MGADLPSGAASVNLRAMVRSRPNQLAGLLAVAVLVGSCSYAPAVNAILKAIGPAEPQPTAEPEPTVATERLGGADRYGVAVSASELVSHGAAVPVVYLAPGAGGVDALAAGPAAARDGGTILYTGPKSLPQAVADELARLAPARVVAVGGTSSIGNAVLQQVTGLLGPGTVVERVSGKNAYATAAALSARSFPTAGVDAVVVASAGDFFGAVAAGPAAALLGAPLLLATRDSLPRETATELRRLAPGRVIVVGGTASVSQAVLGAIDAIVPEVERVSGRDQYATAAAVATRFFPHATAAVAMSGATDAGALAVVPLAAASKAPILLTQPGDQLPKATRGVLVSMKPNRIYIAGALSEIIRGELIGYSDGRLTVPADETEFPAWDVGYHSPSEMLTLIKATEIAYPSLVHVFSIGKSYEGRDIWAAKVSANVSVDEDEPEVMVDALHHAGEHLGTEQALYLLGTLTSGYDKDPQVRRLVDSREVWIIFAVNPDGWAYDISGGYYHAWRKNRQDNGKYNPGTDLNRNYGYMWGCCKASSVNPWEWNYRGTAPFSAPESKAVADFVTSRVVNGKQQIRTHVTLHTHGEQILYPFSYTLDHLPSDMNPDDYAVFRSMAKTMASMNGYTYHQSSFKYPTDGDEIDWMYGAYRIFSFTIELYPKEKKIGEGLVYPSDSDIAKQTARNRGALLYLIDAAACPYAAIAKAAQYCSDAPAAGPSAAP